MPLSHPRLFLTLLKIGLTSSHTASNTMHFNLDFIGTDEFWFLCIQTSLALISVHALYFDKKPKIGVITRSDESRKMFTDFHRLTFATFLVAIFAISDYPKNGKLLYFLLDLILGIYWCFYSTWFTNKLVGIVSAFRSRKYK